MTIARSPKNPMVAYKYITTFNARHIVTNKKITKIEKIIIIICTHSLCFLNYLLIGVCSARYRIIKYNIIMYVRTWSFMRC